MKTKISKLAKGIFEERNVELSVSVTRLTGKCMTDGYVKGSFVIGNMSNEDIRGIVCSDNYRIIIENTAFIGKSTAISYMVNAKGMSTGEKIQGTVSIISDGGELLIPCEFDIIEEYLETSIGKLSNLAHFVNLVQQNFEEALAVFAGKDFARVFIKDNRKMQAVYEGLIKGNDIKNALEEFLIYACKKKRLVFTIKETSKEYDSIIENYADKLVIQKSGWGYARLSVNISGDFIHVVKNEISTEEFVGNTYELSYLIEPGKLHAGNNYGRITIVTSGRELIYEITVHKRSLSENINKKKLKESIVELSNNYFEFRMRRMTTDNWVKNSMQLIDTISEIDDSFDFIKLLRAQVLIAKKRHEEAVGFINEVGTRLRAGKKKQEFLYCYYLYVRTLYSRDVTVTKDAIKEIEEFYKKGQKDVRIMWILLYLDEEYVINKSLRLARIKEQYVKGARSPFFYYEACAVFNEQPGLLRVLNSFEIQALWWGCRNNMLSLKLAEQLAGLVSAERQFKPLLYRIMGYICEKYDDEALLEVLCRYIVSNTTSDRKYFKWYEKGVTIGFEFDGLYEAYMDTLKYTEVSAVPYNVALYFAYNNYAGYDKKAFLFANILKNEAEYSKIIRNYVPQIKAFAKEQLDAGNVSSDLAYIYRKVTEKADIDKNNAANYVKIQLAKKLVCRPGTFAETMSAVIVKHKELDEEMIYPIADGVAYFPEYTEDAVILFEDTHGKRYVALGDYECKSLFNQANILKKALELAPCRLECLLYMLEKGQKRYSKNIIELYKGILTASGGVKKYYINHVFYRMTDYFKDNNDSEKLDYYLKKIDVSLLEPKERTKIIELLLIQGLYDEAYMLIKEYGYEHVSANRLMQLCTIFLQEKKIVKEDTFFTGLCAYVFNCSKYGEDILLYLLRYYSGNTKNLFRLWCVSRDFEADTSDIEERLIIQMLFTETYLDDIMDVFEAYYKKSRKDIVARAYLNSNSYLYFVKNKIIHEKTFKYLEHEHLNDYGLSDISKLALLKYYSGKEELTKKELTIAGEFVAELQKAGCTFAFYKKFADKLVLPFELRDKTILEYKTKKGRYVELKYLLDSEEADEVSYKTEVMEEGLWGNYVRPLVIFYGEKLKYYMTEHESGETELLKSSRKEIFSLNLKDESGKYGLLNKICGAGEHKDEQLLNEAMREYEKQVKLVESCFLPIMEE